MYRRKIKKRIGPLLIENGVISRENLNAALRRQSETGCLLGEILVELGYAREEDIIQAIAIQFNIPYIHLKRCEVSNEALSLIPERVARKYNCFPIDRMGGILTVAASNPIAEGIREELECLTHHRIMFFISARSEIMEAISLHYRQLKGMPQKGGAPSSGYPDNVNVFSIRDNGCYGEQDQLEGRPCKIGQNDKMEWSQHTV